jgi:hypothetical protein
LSCRQAAAHYGVGISTAIKWVLRLRRTGSVSPSKIGGYRPKKLIGSWRLWLLERYRGSDFTLRGLGITAWCGNSCTRRSSVTKKTLIASEQDRPDVARRRMQWLRYRHRIDPPRLVFIDESVLQRNGRSSAWTRTVREAAGKMGAGPPGSAFRSGSQTSPSCCGKEPWW